jgi:hypothetical protein
MTRQEAILKLVESEKAAIELLEDVRRSAFPPEFPERGSDISDNWVIRIGDIYRDAIAFAARYGKE